MQKGNLFIVSGPSGSGKTTLSKNVIKRLNNVKFVVSYTTRNPREGEIDGIDYKFVTDEVFDQLIENDSLSEWAIVHGNRYGTPVEYIEEAESSGIDLIFDIDVQGARSLRTKFNEGVYIFVIPSSLDILRQRLIERKTEEIVEIDKRLDDAKKVMNEIRNYDYIIINDSLNEAVGHLTAVIVAERSRRERILNSSKLNI
ncbi:MAG: guanylate kinase [Thermodesulfobacteriota bacterium]